MNLRLEEDGRLCRIALAMPEKRNFLDAAACRDLLGEITRAAADAQIGAILLEADGPVFCAGADPEDGDLFRIGREVLKPIVVAVQGVALNGGLALVANAHVAVAAQGSSFGLTSIREGKWDAPSFEALACALGHRRATELAITGRVFSTPEALHWGLIHYVAPAFELDDRATEIAMALSDANAGALKQALGSAQSEARRF